MSTRCEFLETAVLYDGNVPVILGLPQLFKVTQAMLEYGFTNEEIKKIRGDNFQRVV